MGSSKASRAVQQAASSVLSQLITGLKHSLLLYNDPQLAHSQYGDALAAVAAAAAAGKFPPADLLSSLHPEAAVAAAAAGVAGTGAAGVSEVWYSSGAYSRCPVSLKSQVDAGEKVVFEAGAILYR